MKYNEDVADDLIQVVKNKARAEGDKASALLLEQALSPTDIWLLNEVKFRKWGLHNYVARMLTELARDMEVVRINNIEDDEEQAREREMDMLVRMGR